MPSQCTRAMVLSGGEILAWLWAWICGAVEGEAPPEEVSPDLLQPAITQSSSETVTGKPKLLLCMERQLVQKGEWFRNSNPQPGGRRGRYYMWVRLLVCSPL